MLMQLVCVDRRYQRMNCFNIRELEGILKRKFFTDLVNTSDNHKTMESTLIGMRHKNNMSNILLYDQSLFYNFDLTNTSKYKNFSLSPGKIYTYASLNSNLLNYPNLSKLINLNLNNPYNSLIIILRDLLYFLHLPTLTSLISVTNSLSYFKTFSVSTLYVFMPNLYNLQVNTSSKNQNTLLNNSNNISIGDSYTSSSLGYSGFNTLLSSNFTESSTS